MDSEEILLELKELSPQDTITKKDRMKILKKYAEIISVYDLMIASAHMRKDGEFVHAQYREKYLEIYVKHFLMRMKEVLANNSYDNGNIDKTAFCTVELLVSTSGRPPILPLTIDSPLL